MADNYYQAGFLLLQHKASQLPLYLLHDFAELE